MALLRSTANADLGPVIRSSRVVLRTPQMGDFPSWADLREKSRSFLTPWEPSWPMDDLTRPAFRRRLRRYQQDMRDDLGYAFFAHSTSRDALVGGLTLSSLRRGVTQSGTLGYWVGAAHARRGYMSEAVKAVIPFVFDTLRLHRLEAACLPSNEASIGLLEKLGFRREGFARSYLKINGAWRDHLLYALLEDDPRP